MSNINLNMLLDCRIRKVGEIMRQDDIVLVANKFNAMGFNTAFCTFYAGLEVPRSTDIKVICRKGD